MHFHSLSPVGMRCDQLCALANKLCECVCALIHMNDSSLPATHEGTCTFVVTVLRSVWPVVFVVCFSFVGCTSVRAITRQCAHRYSRLSSFLPLNTLAPLNRTRTMDSNPLQPPLLIALVATLGEFTVCFCTLRFVYCFFTFPFGVAFVY